MTEDVEGAQVYCAHPKVQILRFNQIGGTTSYMCCCSSCTIQGRQQGDRLSALLSWEDALSESKGG